MVQLACDESLMHQGSPAEECHRRRVLRSTFRPQGVVCFWAQQFGGSLLSVLGVVCLLLRIDECAKGDRQTARRQPCWITARWPSSCDDYRVHAGRSSCWTDCVAVTHSQSRRTSVVEHHGAELTERRRTLAPRPAVANPCASPFAAQS
jgi:hypothetical protein